MKRRLVVVVVGLLAMVASPLASPGADAAPAPVSAHAKGSRLCLASGWLGIGWCLPSLR